MAFRRVDEESGSGRTDSNGRPEMRSWKHVAAAVLFLLVTGVPAAIAWLQGHEMACRGSPGWQRFAGWLGDCAAYAPNPSGPIASAPIASSHPLEVLTRRGYTPDERSLYQALSLGRKDDLELLINAGVRFTNLPIQIAPVTTEMWQLLVDKGAFKEPCKADAADISAGGYSAAETLLDGVLRQPGNLEIYKGLCKGKYVSSIAAIAVKAKEDHARRVAEARAADTKIGAAADRAIGLCKASIDAAIPESLLADYAYCKIVIINTEAQKTKRESACAAVQPAEMALKELEIKLRELGFQWTPPNPSFDCTEYRSCANSVGGDLAEKYFFFVMKASQPDLEHWRRTHREPGIAKACEDLKDAGMSPGYKRVTVPAMAGASFYEKFEKAMASR